MPSDCVSGEQVFCRGRRGGSGLNIDECDDEEEEEEGAVEEGGETTEDNPLI